MLVLESFLRKAGASDQGGAEGATTSTGGAGLEEVLVFGIPCTLFRVEGYLADKKQPPPLGPP